MAKFILTVLIHILNFWKTDEFIFDKKFCTGKYQIKRELKILEWNEKQKFEKQNKTTLPGMISCEKILVFMTVGIGTRNAFKNQAWKKKR